MDPVAEIAQLKGELAALDAKTTTLEEQLTNSEITDKDKDRIAQRLHDIRALQINKGEQLTALYGRLPQARPMDVRVVDVAVARPGSGSSVGSTENNGGSRHRCVECGLMMDGAMRMSNLDFPHDVEGKFLLTCNCFACPGCFAESARKMTCPSCGTKFQLR